MQGAALSEQGEPELPMGAAFQRLSTPRGSHGVTVCRTGATAGTLSRSFAEGGGGAVRSRCSWPHGTLAAPDDGEAASGVSAPRS